MTHPVLMRCRIPEENEEVDCNSGNKEFNTGHLMDKHLVHPQIFFFTSEDSDDFTLESRPHDTTLNHN